MNKPKVTVNPHCPVPGCKTKAPHLADLLVEALVSEFSVPEKLTLWSWVGMNELAYAMQRDLTEKKLFAFLTRLRQPEELYYRSLYALFIASDKELHHMLSGDWPSGFTDIYRKVNTTIMGDRGTLLVKQPGLRKDMFKPMDTLNDGAHVSFRAMLTCVSWHQHPEWIPTPEKYRAYTDIYCQYLNEMHEMFKAGKTKAQVLDAVITWHKSRKPLKSTPSPVPPSGKIDPILR